jgi:hypothetical protein
MKQKPLMMDELTPVKRAALASLVSHPGWGVVEELHMDACKRATEDVLKQDQGEEGSERKILTLQAKARERNEFSLLILRSVQWHIQAAQGQEQEENAKAPENPILQRK